ncbi:hypothetical protein EPI10_027056 [Gossypium australe]|uniref:Uncharacterized protein n=1 Tax=Gossypium australe TaxID=47621 RepID=A0A5B6UTV5_9ROSI|nr:hypothetical protein EPI10_027056 [Gossypium australe]
MGKVEGIGDAKGLEDMPVEFVDGKKRQRFNLEGVVLITPRAINRLNNKLRHIQPHILFLMETKVARKCMEKIRRKCGFEHGIDVDIEETIGGLSLE